MRHDPDRYERTSGKIAKARTELTIASDRLGCSQEEAAQMRREILDILAKYMNLDKEMFEIRMEIIRRARQGVRDVKTIQIK